ncbi:cation-translocating P-type ATPase [Thiohalobacter thiocyanaticus]|uniref:Cation-transporting P-type ATPase n=1 Tax=Thiohalobacter thiocyanaticus TaxID=585455 RepID=A0A426QGZ3_9GAMM|nr:cation-transporting P-type ATPase [Thiohalobacter thiocyanaticus]RRQ21000.1 cation-transporting P-type ATPase [Thiohalobacter thiocyanaticus]
MNNNTDSDPHFGSDQPPVYRQHAQEVLDRLDVEPGKGLGAQAASERLATSGPNRLREMEQIPAWRILLDQFTSPVVVLLLIAAILAALFARLVEAVAISAALLINAVIGFVTEWRARESIESLKRMGRMQARVRRDGRIDEIPADELVPGDIVLLQEGEMVPADLRLIETENLECNEAALTGESVPVAKATDPVDEVPLAERSSMVYSGTAVTRGEAEGVTVATGMDTEIGRISALVESAQTGATPLERRLERLARRLIYLVVVIGVAVAASGIVAGKELFLMVETAIVLAIAAVPEGLPIVSTVALGRGMWRMARRNALIKHLAAVETLGATTVILSDKTGTLTENRMVLRRLALPTGDVELSRADGRAEFRDGETVLDPARREDLMAVLKAGMLCSNAVQEEGQARGDPTEVALLDAGLAADLEPDALREDFPEQREESFDPETRQMATYHSADEAVLVQVKGAPEAVLAACTRVRNEGGELMALDETGRERWRERNQQLAADGLRVLALAEKRVADTNAPPYRELILLGLVGLYDPPRRTVAAAIARCREAGIRVIMVTGDHPATAGNIAYAVGIVDSPRPEVLMGEELSPAERAVSARERIGRTSVFARVEPEQKLRLVEGFQQQGEVVAMTGDGVNDAPALTQADIGIAMGRRGTEVARETSDIVLVDDAFESIVAAIEQGRIIFDNIRKFVVYLLSGNLGQILGVSAAALVNAPLPLLPLQILFLNLLLDVFPALALGVGRGSRAVMRRPPRDPREPILTSGHWWAIAGFGLLMAVALLTVFAYALQVLELDVEQAVTLAFLTYGFARLWHSFNMRSLDMGVFRNDITGNPWVWCAIALCGLLLVGALYTPRVAEVLRVAPPAPGHWPVILGSSLIPLVLGQTAASLLRRRDPAA